MIPRFWTRLGAGLIAGALVALAAPLSTAARELPATAALLPPPAVAAQLTFTNYNNCMVSGGGYTGAGNSSQYGQGQVLSFGSGGFANPYYSPTFGSFGVGTIGGFLNFPNGLPYCTSANGTVQYSGAPYVLSSLGIQPGSQFGQISAANSYYAGGSGYPLSSGYGGYGGYGGYAYPSAFGYGGGYGYPNASGYGGGYGYPGVQPYGPNVGIYIR